jgi:hypothetical protein
MSGHIDERRWEELRRRAATEKDPFKLVLILSEIAAATRQEQEKVKQHLEPAIQNYRQRQERTLKERIRNQMLAADARSQLEIINYANAANNNPNTEREPGWNAQRFLKLADSALHNRDEDVDPAA